MSCLVYGALVAASRLKASSLTAHWGSFFVALNLRGLAATIIAYTKARLVPTQSNDQNRNGNNDTYMGIDLNSRISDYDITLLINGRTRLTSSSNFSFVGLQYEILGCISNFTLVVQALQMLYVVDSFWNEHWYLQTIDVAHDHVGFYLARGCLTWLPSMYTLQAQYLARDPVSLSTGAALTILLVGVFGYAIFCAANSQKYRVRNTGAKCNIWGKPATFLEARYKNDDGRTRTSLLLTSGWWSQGRHINYLSDLLLSFFMCAACGTRQVLSWFYAIYLGLSLLHQTFRDEKKCLAKYGELGIVEASSGNAMASSLEPREGEDYDSEADEDFNPDAAAKQKEEESSSSNEEDDEAKPTSREKRKERDQELDFENSGDEATISKARRKRRKQAEEDDEAGEGGLVKTRAQRKAEGKEKNLVAKAGSSSVDVNAVWAQMSGASAQKPTEPTDSKTSTHTDTATAEGKTSQNGTEGHTNGAISDSVEAHPPTEPMITIKRTYEFAGRKMEEEKSVPASSAEAKLYLEEQARQKERPPTTAPKPGMRRPMKRASMFDTANSTTTAAPAKASKLNTVQKSKLDWASHVDQEGMGDELEEHRRAKGGYLGRMDFLSRMDAKREEGLQSKR